MIRHRDEIRRLFGEGSVAGLSDGQLLERFSSRGDAEAFAAIVARHGVMVLATCRSSLGSLDGAEDAFQATFLVLVRRAGTFPLHGSLAGWLYRVARRVARQVRIESTRRTVRERKAVVRGEAELSADPAIDELHRLIHEELAQLPEPHRAVIQLCDLHGLTRDEAAEAIGCPPGTVAGRLARARVQLRDRLVRRGVTSASAGPLGLAGSLGAGSSRFQEATRRAIDVGLGQSVAPVVAQLAARASRGLFFSRVPVNLALLSALVATGAATAFLAIRHEPAPPPELPPPLIRVALPAPAQAPSPIDLEDPATADVIAGRVVDTTGQPVAGAKVYLVDHDAVRTDPAHVRAVTPADGRFRFSAPDLTYKALDGLPSRISGRLIVTAEGYGPDSLATPGRENPGWIRQWVKGPEWTLTLSRGETPIRGQLLDPTGQPLAGATVILKGLEVPWKWDMTEYLKTLTLVDQNPGYQPRDFKPSAFPGMTTRADSGADGRFRLDGLGSDRIARLKIKGPGIAETWIQVMTREGPGYHPKPDPRIGPNVSLNLEIYGANFTFQTSPGVTVNGVVVDKTTRQPLADITVGPSQPINGDFPDAVKQVTDETGRFSFDGFSPDEKWGDIMAIPKPGLPYLKTKVVFNREGETVVRCPRGIPFRIMIRDEAGQPVEAAVGYSVIAPNSFIQGAYHDVLEVAWSPLSEAARQADGSYLGVALPGPGVVLVKTPAQAGYRPACVDPKAFFAPGRKEWTAQELITTYGTENTLSIATCNGGIWEDQHDYAALVLVNPAEGSKLLELEATVFRDRPRQITLLDPEGRPVVGASAGGLVYYDKFNGGAPTLRTSTFSVTGLHPDRSRRIWFTKEDRKLVGFVMARGDGDSPYTVTMQPWGVVTGRIVDEQGQPLNLANPNQPWMREVGLSSDAWHEIATRNDPKIGVANLPPLGEDGRFRIERIVPGQSYRAVIYRKGRPSGIAFEDLILKPGEVRDLGDIRLEPPGESKKTGIIP